MDSLTIFEFNDQGIRFENKNGQVWVNLTDMAKASGKRVDNWLRLVSTKEYLIALEHSLGSEVMVSNVGGAPETTGTWAIDEVAIDFAQWCYVDFRIWVNRQIKILLTTGKVELNPQPESEPEELSEKQKFLKELYELGLKAANMAKDDRGIIFYNVQIQNLATQIIEHPQTMQPLLPEAKWYSLSEILERAGYPIHQKAFQNSLGQIGKLVKAFYEVETGESVKTIEKLVGTNHKPTEIKIYPENFSDDVVAIAVNYWNKKGLI